MPGIALIEFRKGNASVTRKGYGRRSTFAKRVYLANRVYLAPVVIERRSNQHPTVNGSFRVFDGFGLVLVHIG
ncbi:MAG: hypothetical protein RLZZ282_872 [Verrucomicrobiota bacterium]